MTPEPEPSRLVPVPVTHHPEVVFDMTGGRGVDPQMTRLVPVPVTHFPEVTIEMTAVPSLLLTLRVRPGASAADAGADVIRVWKVLSDYDRTLRGRGLTTGGAVDDGDLIRLTLTPVDPAGAADRLAKLAAAVNDGDPAVPREVLTGRSFVACRAELPPAA
jgi:hypothetical protein